ncbi:regulatory-associated protein of mTOR-like isoform X2 [Apostichopus japonicus]|uniref:regulatory-associated protein of mTOR-like isoform X2 n=1 Tax=Stichopus japonicus TaxID=307972 RepID=UPI003AB65DE1
MYDDIIESEESDLCDWQLPLAFMKKRHIEKIEGGTTTETQSWRMKERMKTVSVALVLCLNVGVDPPDIIKTSPCARLECWIDPLATAAQKALEAIGSSLQKQYERWQPRARYKQSLDPTVDEVKKLCTSLRRNSKEERVLFHYNGHGVPKPTTNGEIWVFNKNYTQYIPLSIYDLQTWMGSPSIFVYDCSNAGLILDSFQEFAKQKEQERAIASLGPNSCRHNIAVPPSAKNCIQLAACASNELLPMNPELPADLFTSCLTTPIKIALRWFCYHKSKALVPGVTVDLVDKIPGRLNDRRTPLGELNWIFTAITDTIAWNVLPRELFQKLFRQDLLVASLFRNFLLAERIMRSYNCTPISSPQLPPTYQHPMWQAWDLAVDISLSQLPDLIKGGDYQHSPFFAEQLTAFQVWLTIGCEGRQPPEQLPIVLQVLLSQVHRLRALDLLGRFLDLGPWAVSLALSVGIFPYVLKLLQSSARELRHLLVFIWAKILAVDRACKADLVKDTGHKYFLSVLSDPFMPAQHRTMAAFVLAMIAEDYAPGQEAALQCNVIAICLEQLNDNHPLLRQWLAVCLGRVWTKYDAARWYGVRSGAHENLYRLLTDPVPEVRAAAVYALGTFIGNSGERTDHGTNIDHNVGMTLITVAQDGSPIVRKELVVALYQLISQFEAQFASIARQVMEDDSSTVPAGVATTPGGWLVVHDSARSNVGTSRLISSATSSGSGDNSHQPSQSPAPLARIASSSSLSSAVSSYSNIYVQIWTVMLQLASDPYPGVKQSAQTLVNEINLKATVNSKTAKAKIKEERKRTSSAPSSPTRNSGSSLEESDSSDKSTNLNYGPTKPLVNGDSPPQPNRSNPTGAGSNVTIHSSFHSYQFPRTRKIFDKGPDVTVEDIQEVPRDKTPVNTQFTEWCSKYFAQSVMKPPEELDPYSPIHQSREWRFVRNKRVREDSKIQMAKPVMRPLNDQIFVNKNQGVPVSVKFHPFVSHVVVADREGVCFWNWENGEKLNYFTNSNGKGSRITSLGFMNSHDITLLYTGADSGSVRIWKHYLCEDGNPVQIVSAWQGLTDMLQSTRGSGMVLDWEQESGFLLASGDVRVIRVWDTQKELCLQDIPTGADSCVTSLACDSMGRSLLIAGCGDGSLRLYDRRLAPTDSRVMTLREHDSWVTNVYLEKGSTGDGKIISASDAGDIRFWDPRFTESVKLINTFPSLTAMAVHSETNLIACGYSGYSSQQLISVYNTAGDALSHIKYYDGFIGQRIGPVSCLAFHPYRNYLAAGSRDSFLSIYSTDKKR